MPDISLERIDSGIDAPRLNVVFIHGLGGNPIAYWCHQGGKDDGYFWLSGLAEDVPGTAVWTVGYPADKASWGTGWPVAEAATAVLDKLTSSQEFRATGNIPIVFVCHSLGGIIAKKLVLTAHLDRGQQPVRGEFLDRIAGIVFLATPHSGSILANIAGTAHWFVSHTMNELTANNASLLDLSHTYRDRIANGEAKIRHRVYYEGEGVWGAEVVTPASADPGLPGVRPVKINRDHTRIQKPIDKKDPVYEGILSFLQDEVLKAKKTSDESDEAVILTPIPSDSRIITGDMIVRGGNYIDGTPFAFEAAMMLRASVAGDIISFEATLYRERNVTIFPPGKTMDDYTPEAWAALPTEPVRHYPWNRQPGKLSGAYGIFGGGNNTSPLNVSDPMIVIDGDDVLLRRDFSTLRKPFRLDAGRAVIVHYARVCSPALEDEAPADYIYCSTVECKLGFLPSTARSVTPLSWILDYSEGGKLALRI